MEHATAEKSFVLIATNDPEPLALLCRMLAAEGFEPVITPLDGGALERCAQVGPRLFILDIASRPYVAMSLLSGIRRLPQTRSTTVFAITAEQDEEAAICALEMGADDCSPGATEVNIIIARVRAILRRRPPSLQARSTGLDSEPAASEEPREGTDPPPSFVINHGTRSVLVDGQPIHLTYTEFEIMKCLAEKPGWVFSRCHIIDRVRGNDYAVTERAIDVHLVALRKKLGRAGSCIQTVRGVGYRFMPEPISNRDLPRQHTFSIA
jgi:two-component system alkaline phosphatase synthesis response regulator PhoP